MKQLINLCDSEPDILGAQPATATPSQLGCLFIAFITIIFSFAVLFVGVTAPVAQAAFIGLGWGILPAWSAEGFQNRDRHGDGQHGTHLTSSVDASQRVPERSQPH